MDKIEKSLYLTQREHKEVFSQDDPRTNFVHDRDRIIHSKAFRRLMHKTQIFNANKGDHFRNRLTHTLEVAQIARSIGRRMNLKKVVNYIRGIARNTEILCLLQETGSPQMTIS